MLTKTDSTGATNYAWDYENRLTSVTLPGSGGTVSFKYDPLGRRIYKSSSGATSIFAYDGDNLIEETNSNGAVVARYSGSLSIDEPLAMLRSGTTSFYNADGLATITSLANTAGSLAQTYTFDSFGKQTASSGSLTNPFQYTARESDLETGLYYYRARYYNPTIGRFISMDPIGFKGGDNFYAFVRNNPLFLRDPNGTCPTGDDCKITIMRPGMTPADMYNWCANNGMKLIWLADCSGDKNCCIDKLAGYRKPCEDQRFVYHVQIAAQLYGGWCCRDNR